MQVPTSCAPTAFAPTAAVAPRVIAPAGEEARAPKVPRPAEPTPGAAAAAATPAAPPTPTGPPAAPVVAMVKVVGLPCGNFPGLCFYATSLPLTLGRGATHVQPWASGDHCALGTDMKISSIHAEVDFEPLSRTYEMRVLGRRSVRCDGHEYKRDAVMRLGSGSCARIGGCELCFLLPQAPRGATPRPLPLPPLPGAGGPAPPALAPVVLALHALREAPGGKLSLCEMEGWVRRVFPQTKEAFPDAEIRAAWRSSLLAALEALPPNLCSQRFRAPNEPGDGGVWVLTPSAAAGLPSGALAGAPALPGVYTVMGLSPAAGTLGGAQARPPPAA